MKRDPGAPLLSAVFVDYDNIYLSLKRRDEEAARRFSKHAAVWLKALEKGRIIASDGGFDAAAPRRIVLNRCYGNPVPRRNPSDNTTDMNSFPFVRHHFLRAGFEIVDCPPLTSQQKNAADIRMVMDLRDYLTHATYFDEFIILSGDADFTPVLHRLRQHARRTVIYSNDHTAAAYSAISDGEVREADLIQLLLGGAAQLEAPAVIAPPSASAPLQPVHAPAAYVPVVSPSPAPPPAAPYALQSEPPVRPQAAQLRLEDLRQMIMAEVIAGIRTASAAVPLEALADRAIRTLGHERTVGTAWAGAGSFRELMRIALPADLRLTEQPPFHAYDPQRHVSAAPSPLSTPMPSQAQAGAQALAQQREALAAAMADLTQVEAEPAPPPPVEPRQPRYAALRPSAGPAPRAMVELDAPVAPAVLTTRAPSSDPIMHRGSVTRPVTHAAPVSARVEPASPAQAAMARIQEAAQAPALSAADYRIVFTAMAQEISENGLTGAQTLTAVAERAEAHGVVLRKEDIRFVLDVVSEPDPWFEQGASPTLFAGRFRNFVVARCRDFGLQLGAKDLDLVDAWIMGVAAPAQARGFAAETQRAAPAQAQPAAPQRDAAGGRWWAKGDDNAAPQTQDDDFPRIVRTRRG